MKLFFTLLSILLSSKTYQTYAESLNIQNLLYTSLVYLAICHQPSGRLLICSILADKITKNQIYHTTKSEVRVLFMQARCSNSLFLFNRQNSKIIGYYTVLKWSWHRLTIPKIQQFISFVLPWNTELAVVSFVWDICKNIFKDQRTV